MAPQVLMKILISGDDHKQYAIQQIFYNVYPNVARPGLHFPASLSRAQSVWGRSQALLWLCFHLEPKAAATLSTVQNEPPRGTDWSNVVILSPW